MSQVNTELGIPSTTTISLDQANVRALAGVPSGTISMSNLQGKSNTIPIGYTVLAGGGGGGSTGPNFTGQYGMGGGGAGALRYTTASVGSGSYPVT
ncbi:hypothetical protein EBT31_14570, partial [bacterium]|nr:hypothetical protein [bacterium]